MRKLDLSRISVLLCDPDHAYRSSIFGMLRGIEIKSVTQAANMKEIQQQLAITMPDLLITESQLPDGDICNFIHRMRHDSTGANPFLPIITLTAEPTAELVRNIVNSGSDDLLTKPMSAAQLLDRITTMIDARKPFVVTSDYIGPTRRKAADRDSNVELIEVPNILREKASGGVPDKGYQKVVDDMMQKINLQKLERYAFQIGYLTERIMPALQAADINNEIIGYIKRLGFVASDARRRLGGTKYDHVSSLCESLIKVTKDIHKDPANASDKNVRLLEQLSAAIQASFEAGTAQTARQIVESLEASKE
ncbi:MAG: response regulator transcription factor [Alphaproteobacteria bacterium]